MQTIQQALKRHGLALLVLAAAATLYTDTVASHGMFMWDEAEYASMARAVARGDGFSINGHAHSLRLPLLPLAGAGMLLISASQGSASQSDATLKAANILFALLTLGAVYWFIGRVYDNETGVAAAAFLAVAPAFWDHTSFFLTEIPFLGLFFTALAALLIGLYEDERFFYLSWVATALALLTRYMGVLLGPLVLAFIVAAFVWGGAPVRARLRSKAFYAAPFLGLATLAPWLIRQQVHFGDFLVGFKRASGQLQNYMPGVSMPWSFYLERMPLMILWVGVVFVCISAAWVFYRRDRCGLHLLLVAAFLFLWFGVYRYKEVRLLTAVLPLLAALAALGLRPVLARLKDYVRPAVVGVVAAVLFAHSYHSHRVLFDQTVALGYPSFTAALAHIQNHSSPQAVTIAASVPQAHWYTDRPIKRFSLRQDLDASLDGVEWVVVTNFERGQRPYAIGLTELFDQRDVQAGLIRVFQSGQFATAVIRAAELKKRL